MKFKKWLLTNKDQKLFFNSRTDKYEVITLSNERINEIVLDAINEFNDREELLNKYDNFADEELDTLNHKNTIYDDFINSIDLDDDIYF